jgi:hypothetical protein
MVKYDWREESSLAFGKVRRPVAEVHIKDKNATWRAITMLVDSGADISIITRSFGELFGHDVEKGRRIKLKGVGDFEIIAFVHTMDLLIGKHEMNIEVAISENDKIGTNVLGRKIVFDLFEIHFKNLARQTWFAKRS